MQKCGTQFTPDQLGDSPLNKKHHLSAASFKKRMDCLTRVRLMCPKLPLALEVEWEVRKLAYCKRCPGTWHRSTGTKFQHATNLLVAELGTHYGGYARVENKRTPQDKAFLAKYLTKPPNNKGAFADFVEGLKEWMPQSMTYCLT